MSTTKLVFLIAFSFLIFTNCGGDDGPAQGHYNDGMSPPAAAGNCGNCSICPYTCRTPPPPPAMGYPSYGTPPPPPPPPPPTSAQGYCPPTAPVQCCQYSPPSPFYSPVNNNNSGSAKLKPLNLIKPSTSTWCLAIFFVLSYICL